MPSCEGVRRERSKGGGSTEGAEMDLVVSTADEEVREA